MLPEEAVTSGEGLGFETVEEKSRNCGRTNWKIKWDTHGKSGVIIQNVEMFANVTDCKGNVLDNSEMKKSTQVIPGVGGVNSSDFPYFESFDASEPTDSLTIVSFGKCTKGRVVLAVTAKFYPDKSTPPGMKPNLKHPSGGLPMSMTPPSITGESGSISRTLSATWNCCPNDERPTTAEKNNWRHLSPLSDLPLRRIGM